MITDTSFPLRWFVPILFFEALSQEVNRNLICLGSQVKANITLLDRVDG